MTDQPKITTTTSSVLKFGNKVTAGQIKHWLESVPDTAEITVSKYNGDQRDPTETTFTAMFPA